MIILHAGFHNNRFLLWAEKKIEEEIKIKKRRGKRPKNPRPKLLPYDAGLQCVLEAFKKANIHFGAAKSKDAPGTAVAWIPTVNKFPIPSSSIIYDIPGPNGDTYLAPWIVSTLQLPMGHVIDLLCQCAGKDMLAHGIFSGDDLKFWVKAIRFTGSLVVRQRFLPGIVREGGEYRARWEPVLTGEDPAHMAKLADSMPSVCRALAGKGEDAPDSPATDLLAIFINEVLDYIVRFQDHSPSTFRRKQRTRFDSIHDRWLYALRSSYDEMDGDPLDMDRLMGQIRDWRRPIYISSSSPFRLCFKLEEPEKACEDASGEISKSDMDPEDSPDRSAEWDDPEKWKLRFLLQAIDDQSLLVPVRDGWSGSKDRLAIFNKNGFNVREYLLASLGQASGIYPLIIEGLKTPEPEGCGLDTEEAFEFLTEKAVLLARAGFGILLPAWWTRKGTKTKLISRARAKSAKKVQAGGYLSMDDVIHLNWEVAIGNETLTYQELMSLAELKSPLVKFRGQWVQLNPDEIQEALDFWKKKSKGETTVRDVIRMSLGVPGTDGNLEFGGVYADGWVADLLEQLKGDSAYQEMSAPKGFHGKLRPYQVRGLSWLKFLQRCGLGACLADDMGLGKTIQVLASIQKDWEQNNRRPVLIICPTSVTGNWLKEAFRFTPDLPAIIHHGPKRKKGKSFRKETEDKAIVVSSYSLLHRDFKTLSKVDWSGIVLDEAQNIKNPETKQAKAARSLEADYKVALTGTPVENNVGDLWSIMEFLNPGFLGNYAEFRRNFYIPIQLTRDHDAAQNLKNLTEPFILRRLKTDKSIITDLPDKMEMKVFCNLTREQASLYVAMVRETEEALETAEGMSRRGLILGTIMKLKQICNHPRQFLGDNSPVPGRSGKLARITDMMDEIIQVGERALLFTQFAEMGHILKQYLEETFGREVFFLYGATPRKKRERMIEAFQEDPDGPHIFILSLKAGGTGLNLTRANHVFHFDRWWNPAVENQATDRVFRIGQTKDVQVHKFVCLGTMEEKIDEIIEQKKEIAESVVGTGEGWLTELSTDELKEIFKLREEAIGD